MKICKKCNQMQHDSNFAKNASRKDGLQSWCKKCHLEYDHIYRTTDHKKNKTVFLFDQKTCGRCHIKKSISEYDTNSNKTSSGDGLQHWCKKCHKEYKAEKNHTKRKKHRKYPRAVFFPRVIRDLTLREKLYVILRKIFGLSTHKIYARVQTEVRVHGVYEISKGHFLAHYERQNERIDIGIYSNAIQAAEAYDSFVINFGGRACYLNFPDQYDLSKLTIVRGMIQPSEKKADEQ